MARSGGGCLLGVRGRVQEVCKSRVGKRIEQLLCRLVVTPVCCYTEVLSYFGA